MKDIRTSVAATGFLLIFVGVVAADERPNVLLIRCDDLSYSDLGCYGGEIQTPHINRLAAEGMRFTQFYNCGVCVTTLNFTSDSTVAYRQGVRIGSATFTGTVIQLGIQNLRKKWLEVGGFADRLPHPRTGKESVRLNT